MCSSYKEGKKCLLLVASSNKQIEVDKQIFFVRLKKKV